MIYIEPIKYAVNLGIAFLFCLLILFLIQLIRGKRRQMWYVLSRLVNYGILLPFCLFVYMRFALVVLFSDLRKSTERETLIAVKTWLQERLLEISFFGIFLLIFLLWINYLFKKWLQHKSPWYSALTITGINGFILILSFLLIYNSQLNDMMSSLMRVAP